MSDSERLAAVIRSSEAIVNGLFQHPKMFGTPHMVETCFLDHVGVLLIAKVSRSPRGVSS
jgi:hypothetical protein